MNDEFYCAQYARAMAEEIKNGKLKDELTEIYKHITKAVENGEFQVRLDYYNKHNPKYAIDVLKSKGYNVEIWTGDQRDPAYDVIISW